MFTSVLIANRGAIAVRIIRTLKKMGVHSIAIYSEADNNAPHVNLADEAWPLGEGRAAETYLNQELILDIVQKSGAQAVHPGYGFLSENAGFCKVLETAGVAFIGPTAENMHAFGLKHEARALALQNNVPLLPGSSLLGDVEDALVEAQNVGYPVMLKSTAGGGGIGMQICQSASDLSACWSSIKRLGANNFANAGVFVEKYIEYARHVEVQVFGDGNGDIVLLGDRDCSAQRRHQKVIEEAPAPNIPAPVRAEMHRVSRVLTSAVNYRNAGTVEFIYDQKNDTFYFLEVNTRLQVEHGVTELIFGVDLVEWMVKQAAGVMPSLMQMDIALKPKGHAVQARIYAENPNKDFQPATGTLTALAWPESYLNDATSKVRIDHWLEPGLEITPLYDPMLAKVMAYAPTRKQAVALLAQTLSDSVLQGVVNNKEYVQAVLSSEPFKTATMYTRYLSQFNYLSRTLEVVSPGTMTTVQDYPGRIGYWHVGVPPSGPFDAYSFRLGNRLLGNAENAAGLEITLNGPTLLFHCDVMVVLTGAPMTATLDDQAVAFNQPFKIKGQQILKIGAIENAGARAYLMFAGGFKCEGYLGSQATFTLGQFGGFTGRALRTGDILPLAGEALSATDKTVSREFVDAPSQLIPKIKREWTLHVIYGPHGAPDFFTEDDIKQFFSATWKVHYNSSRTGVRLIGPKPQWARSDGGEAGLHPSNIHDNAYAIGAVDFTGDMPVILGPDGPSLGGFVCPVTVISADLWKLGQLTAGDQIQFVPVALTDAVIHWREHNQCLHSLEAAVKPLPVSALNSPVVKTLTTGSGMDVVYRVQGDQNILVEYGPLQLDIRIRFRIHALMLWLQDEPSQDIMWQQAFVDITPGVRSLQIHYNPLVCELSQLLDLLAAAEVALDQASALSVPSRIVHIPLSWDDEQCKVAVQKYIQSVRKDAPWCPDNIEFIRRINGLESAQAVKDIVFSARYVVLGLGDVYLGAPVATPLDPRHRLVTTKYNPARTWTAENSVGIGGSYMCVYGMEGPGGYQFVGRTLQMWNRYRKTEEFTQPWLLRFFDQIQFYEVSADELRSIRKKFPAGQYPIRIEPTQFSLTEYESFLEKNQAGIDAFSQKRNVAFQEELERWVANGLLNFDSETEASSDDDDTALGENCTAIESPVSGSIWQLNINEGQKIKEGDVLCVLESMKMEIEVYAPESGVVQRILRKEGQQVSAGHSLFIVKNDEH